MITSNRRYTGLGKNSKMCYKISTRAETLIMVIDCLHDEGWILSLHGLEGLPFETLFTFRNTVTRGNGYWLFKKFSHLNNLASVNELLRIRVICLHLN